MNPDPSPFGEEPVPIPVDGTLDLHTFRPAEVKELLGDYLDACRQAGILDVRVVHGKGSGALRELVHAQLRHLPGVRSFRLGDERTGGWGATLVRLDPESPGTGA